MLTNDATPTTPATSHKPTGRPQPIATKPLSQNPPNTDANSTELASMADDGSPPASPTPPTFLVGGVVRRQNRRINPHRQLHAHRWPHRPQGRGISGSRRVGADVVPVIVEVADDEEKDEEELPAQPRHDAPPPASSAPSSLDEAASAEATAAPEDDDDDDDDDDDAANRCEDDASAAVRCIFLCEFHATAGPRITAQAPAGYISKEMFDTVSRYIIPKLQLQRSFLSVSLLGHKILGYPVRIDNQLYARNAFYFNVCFVFAPSTRTVVYEPVVRKLTEYMLSMELSTKLLSQANDPAQVARLCRLLTQIRGDLNRKQMCMLQEGSSIIPLCIVPHQRKQPVIRPHGAAVLNDRFHQHAFGQWDLTTLRILPYVNGFNHVARISALADVAVALVLDCVRHLVLLGVASAVPVFQYSNVYRPTPKLAQLAKCRELQRRCLDRCSKSVRCRATVRDVFRMFASMAHGATFGELCVRFNPAALHINDRCLVLFGLIEGLIRRVDKYPVTVSRNLFVDAARATAQPAAFESTLALGGRNRASRPLPRSLWPLNGRMADAEASSSVSAASAAGGRRWLDGRWQPAAAVSFGKRTGAGASTLRGGGGGVSQRQQQQEQPPQPTPHYYNGLKSLDEICCARGISCQQLEQQLAHDRHVIVLLR